MVAIIADMVIMLDTVILTGIIMVEDTTEAFTVGADIMEVITAGAVMVAAGTGDTVKECL